MNYRGFPARPSVTISYFLVTLLAALTIEAATTFGSFLQDVQLSEKTSLYDMLERREAPQVVPFLEQAPPDQESLQRWLSGPLFNAISYYYYETLW